MVVLAMLRCRREGDLAGPAVAPDNPVMRSPLHIAFAAATLALAPRPQSVYEQDFELAVAEIEKSCGDLMRVKGIDWKAVERELAPAAKAAASDQDHLVVLTRLLARLNDGHAEVRRTDRTKDLRWPEDGKAERGGVGPAAARGCPPERP